MSDTKPDTTRAATDIPEFIGELDGGVFEHMLSVALSEVSANVVDHQKKGSVSINFEIERIPGTHQVRIAHVLKFVKPHSLGKSSDEVNGATVFHTGKFGRLSLAQPSLLEKGGKARQSRIDD